MLETEDVSYFGNKFESRGRDLFLFRHFTGSEENQNNCRLHSLTHARPTRSSRSTCRARHSVVSPAEIFERRKRLLTLSLIKSRLNAEASVKTYGLFAYRVVHHITNYSVALKYVQLATPKRTL